MANHSSVAAMAPEAAKWRYKHLELVQAGLQGCWLGDNCSQPAKHWRSRNKGLAITPSA